ncbi:glycosyl hydrolase [Marispirochaeta sp.]|uniref:glycosyl hydrolase n=1 Tax=Marispirochaeta sp. TaxID=2038653 RepID=UPI0029C82CDA|nr:glycosyl hydrolase [Marispirochaeta sp.]
MDIFSEFAHPDRIWSPIAFWFWNGELNPDFLAWQMDEMTDKGVYGGFMHARAYLKTPYLGKAWWKAVGRCVEHGREIGFSPWLYDEYAWPSGTVGSIFEYGYQEPSRILAMGEEHMAKGLSVKTFGRRERIDREHLLAEFPGKDGTTLTFYRICYPLNVDYLNSETIERFIEMTHEAYKKRYGKDFGKLIPGIFFDEIYNRGVPFPWTDRLPAEFMERCGYDLIPKLPLLVQGDGEEAERVRFDYYTVVARLYEEAFFRQISEWCERSGLRLTGHTEEEFRLHPRRQGHYFRTMRHLSIPGADNHDYRYKLPRKITFWEPKYAVSVARAYGRERAMSEALGGAGWGCSLQELKRGINVLGAMGINFFTLHGFYNECEHQGSQADWPASFFYQNPYWKYFRIFGDYISRISLMNGIGRAAVDIGLYYPVEELYVRTAAGEPDAEGESLSRGFQDSLVSLLSKQMDTDMIDAESICRARVDDAGLHIGTQTFKILVCPVSLRYDASVWDTFSSFISQRGYLIFYPVAGDTVPPKVFADSANCRVCKPCELPSVVETLFQPDVRVLRGDDGELYVNHRNAGERDIYMIVNGTDRPREAELLIRCRGHVSMLHPETGRTCSVPAEETENGTIVRLALQEDELVFLVFGGDPPQAEEDPRLVNLHTFLAVTGKWEFLPLPGTYKYDRDLPDIEDTQLEIPLAVFSGTHNGPSDLIRIRNTADQPGCCGRHLSAWEARWITRRPGWSDDIGATHLYYRKSFTLNEPVLNAELCAAAVGAYTLYVNGIRAGEGGTEPTTWPVGDLIRPGENLIAADVLNRTPMADANYAEAETLPADRLTSLLLEGEFQSQSERVVIRSDSSWLVCRDPQPGWETLEFSVEGRTARSDARISRRHDDIPAPNMWIQAWERGRPPLQPWGDIPRCGRKVVFPQEIAYRIELPLGTTEIRIPDVRGNFSCFLDGLPLRFEEESAALSPNGMTRQLVIVVTATSPDDGLLSPLKVRVRTHESPLGDWRFQGLSWFSGYGLYRNRLALKKRRKCRYYLDLGDVRFYAEVFVNRRRAGICLWQPYRLDITEYLESGDNLLEIVVANSAAVERRHMLVDEGAALAWNRYWNEDNIDREPQNLISGLLGPVRLYIVKSE